MASDTADMAWEEWRDTHMQHTQDQGKLFLANQAFRGGRRSRDAEVARIKHDWNTESKGLNDKVAELKQKLFDCEAYVSEVKPYVKGGDADDK